MKYDSAGRMVLASDWGAIDNIPQIVKNLGNLTTSAGGIIVATDTAGTLENLAVGDDGDVLTLVDGLPAWGGVPAGWSYQLLSAQQSYASLTSTEVPDLTLTLGVGTFLCKWILAATALASSNGGLTVALNVTADPTLATAYQVWRCLTYGTALGASGAGNTNVGYIITTLGQSDSDTNSGSWIELNGILKVTTGGSLTLSAGQSVAGYSSTPSYLNLGSYAAYAQIA